MKGLGRALFKSQLVRVAPFLVPWAVGMSLFTLVPIVLSAYYSLCYFDGGEICVFIGLRNYFELLREDPVFWVSMKNTLYMLVIGLPISLTVCLFIALALVHMQRTSGFLRAIIYAPSMMPVVAVSILWLWLLNTDWGAVNAVVSFLGLPRIPWLSDPAWAKPALILMGIWSAGPTILIYYAALLQVPQSLYEAAALDGANWLQRFRHITIPAISPAIYFTVVTGIIGYFQYFSQAYVMTAGGPQQSTLFYALHMFNEAFLNWRMGYASAMAWLLFVLSVMAVFFVQKTSKKWVFYE